MKSNQNSTLKRCFRVLYHILRHEMMKRRPFILKYARLPKMGGEEVSGNNNEKLFSFRNSFV
jgi:hypothetical protein